MPSERKQLNVRLDDEMSQLFVELLPLAKESTGLNVSQSDLVRLALMALKREYAERGKGKRANPK